MTKIFGITGRKRAGKNTLAGFLQPDTRAHVAFAAPIKEVLLRVNPQITGRRISGSFSTTKGQERLVSGLPAALLAFTSATRSEIYDRPDAELGHLLDVLDPFIEPEPGNAPLHLRNIVKTALDYEDHKTEGNPIDDEIRRLQQVLGTDIGREYIAEDIWLRTGVDAIKTALDDRHEAIVVTDVRFDNEAWAIRELGGKIIEIIRPELPEEIEDTHASESGIDSALTDIVLRNDLDLHTLEKDARIIYDLEH